ncbi:S9 family peptidase [Propioniciclava coleopterorum]|uniref:S9 family peptidase n=1 Tax=Propioniciclava coleopterorum TaxID=2714937 RepID=A0A6G7Y9F8_9ACTN|nr:S9 family peptidase [Propioniciclava coleopterorum]QIK73410.1 S9 family peptidase [Propioniciclava coleopterorum]
MPEPKLTPPRAPERPYIRTVHGDAVADPYHWMADKTDPDLLAFLEGQNAYTEQETAHLAPLTETLFGDLKARTKQTDLSVPTHVTHTDGSSFWYYSRTTEGLDYPSTYRVPATSRDDIPDVTTPPEGEQLVMDVQALAEGHDFFSMGHAQVSPDGTRLAYSTDVAGDERYDLWFADLATGEVIDGPLPGVGAGGAWAGRDWFFYTRVDAAWRPHQVWRHELGGATPDALVVEEPDERFWIGVDDSRDHRWIIIEASSKLTSEAALLPADDPTAAPRVVAPRRQGVDYSIEVAPDGLWVLHNDGAPQFALSRAPLDATSAEQWEPVLAEDPRRRLTGVTVYERSVVVEHRTDGLAGIMLLPRDAEGRLGDPVELEFDENLYDVGAEESPDFDTDRIRFGYESLVSPPSVWEYRLDTGERRLLKETPVLDHPQRGPYDRSVYVSERLWATAPDGTRVPVSVVRHRDTPVDGTAAGLLYGYGAYESATMPYFAMSRLSLLDRGLVFAIAHVRGGGELGRPWYEGGKGEHKANTFSDFVAAGRLLVEQGYVAPDRLLAEGGSAGGLLIGAALNLAPDLFRAAHAVVPFVDPLTTILNPELPLTVMEWEEWGNPVADPAIYAAMKAYSPYENVAPVPYPAILVTTSLNDTRVEVTEPAKWTARLQTTATNPPERPILLKTEMVAGHGGVSGRYKAWRERAFQLAWLLDQVGVRE